MKKPLHSQLHASGHFYWQAVPIPTPPRNQPKTITPFSKPPLNSNMTEPLKESTWPILIESTSVISTMVPTALHNNRSSSCSAIRSMSVGFREGRQQENHSVHMERRFVVLPRFKSQSPISQSFSSWKVLLPTSKGNIKTIPKAKIKGLHLGTTYQSVIDALGTPNGQTIVGQGPLSGKYLLYAVGRKGSAYDLTFTDDKLNNKFKTSIY